VSWTPRRPADDMPTPEPPPPPAIPRPRSGGRPAPAARRAGLTLALTAAAVLFTGTLPANAAPAAASPTGASTAGSPAPGTATRADVLPARTRLFVPPADQGALRQIAALLRAGNARDAALIWREVTTPQAVWFTSGTPAEVRQQVRLTILRAALQRAVPTLVLYNVPGRDCSQYSSGGAGSDEAYRAWIDGVAAGLPRTGRVVIVVEPDGLANLPSDCAGAYPGQDIAALTAGRIADIRYAGQKLRQANAQALVYLDAGHSAWHSVGDMAKRLDQAGVRDLRGFSINVSNYQPTPQLGQYGTWIAKCLWYANNPAEGGWRLGHYDFCASQYFPATASDYSTWYLTDNWYAENVDTAAGAPPSIDVLTHFVVDSSRNGLGPWTDGTGYPDRQDWCNPPNRALGPRPTPTAASPLVDALLWVKIPGQSDGQCNRGVAGSTTDPEWAALLGIPNFTDPAAGSWFPQQALQLARLSPR
jgi:endoglucanase